MRDDAAATAPAQRADEGRKRWQVAVVAVVGLSAPETAWSGGQVSRRDGIPSSAHAGGSD